MIKTHKGQAAITDALFFMLIVSGLAASLFVFTASFGKGVSSFVEGSYSQTYATTALKTILYSNTPRSTGTIETAKDVDFLMTLIKEDYANLASNQQFDVATSVSPNSLKKVIDEIMEPIDSSNDYMVYIKAEQDNGGVPVTYYPLVYLKFSIPNPDVSDNVIVEEKAFFCNPASINFSNKLSEFVVDSQASGRSVIPIELKQIVDDGSGQFLFKSNDAQIGIIIWKTKQLTSFNEREWGCVTAI